MFCWAKWLWWIRHILCTSLCLHSNWPPQCTRHPVGEDHEWVCLVCWVFSSFGGAWRVGGVAWSEKQSLQNVPPRAIILLLSLQPTVHTKSNCLCVHSSGKGLTRFCLKGQRMGDKVRHRYLAAQQEPLNFRFQALSKFNYGRQALQR